MAISKKLKEIVIVILSLSFFMASYIFDGVVICEDSHSYIEGHLSREPFYPMLISLFRNWLGTEQDMYLKALVFLQCLLWAICTIIFVDYLTTEFDLKFLSSLIILALCLLPSVLCRFFASRGSMYSNSIMTEGICIPLYLLFIRFLIDHGINRMKRDLVAASVICLILISTRKQMYVTLILLALMIVYTGIKRSGEESVNSKKSIKTISKAFLSALVTVVLIIGLNRAYEYYYNSNLQTGTISHRNDNRFLTTVAFYVSEREDAEYIKEDETRELYLEIYDICESEGSMMHDSGKGLFEKADHFADHYDMIQIDHMWPMFEGYAESKMTEIGETSKGPQEELVDRISSDITRAILPHRIPEVTGVFARNIIKGFGNTVARSGRRYLPFVIPVYLIYLALMILNIKKHTNEKLVFVSSVCLLAVAVNIFVTSAVIFPQVRYMIYNMPVFYSVLYLMIRKALLRSDLLK
ncbi:MAG: hypothetical protein K6A38_05665 [Lachnospiraceae bacterium]|nr:hypothetical protein [Lachnospiraceae bacterium]